MNQTQPTYITAVELGRQWGVAYEYVTEMRCRRHDPLPLFLLPEKKRGYVGIVSEINDWMRRNR